MSEGLVYWLIKYLTKKVSVTVTTSTRDASASKNTRTKLWKRRKNQKSGMWKRSGMFEVETGKLVNKQAITHIWNVTCLLGHQHCAAIKMYIVRTGHYITNANGNL